MSEAVIVALIISLPPTAVALATLIVTIMNRTVAIESKDIAEQAHHEIKIAREEVQIVHKTTNGLLEKLNKETETRALAEGHLKGVADEKKAAALESERMAGPSAFTEPADESDPDEPDLQED